MYSAQIFRRASTLSLGVLLGLIWFGCADESPALTVAQGCSLSSECKSPLVCAFAKCHQACKSTRDCPTGERCVQSDRPYYVCQRLGCARNSDCLGKQICAVDGQCRDECLTGKDCLPDQVCTSGACADPQDLVNGMLPVSVQDAGIGQRCTLPTDCPGDLVCLRGGVCGPECIGDKDCPKTYACKPKTAGGPGRCFPPDTSTQPDASTDASSDAGGGAQLQVAAGGDLSCVIFRNGQAKCWGRNSTGQLGLGDVDNRGDQPNEMGDKLPNVMVGTGRSVKMLGLGVDHGCALLDNDKIKCWGYNSAGLLGVGDQNNRGDGPGEMGDALAYVDLGTGRSASRSSSALEHACALLDNGKVKCWGYNGDGQLGLGDIQNRGDEAGEMGDALPYVDVGTGRSVKALSAGSEHTCVLLDNGKVKCWGQGGQLLGLGDAGGRGDKPGQMGDNLPSVDLGTGRTVKVLAAGAYHTCVILDDDTVKCWGSNEFGQLGLGDAGGRGDKPGQMGDALPTVDLGAGRTAKSLMLGGFHSCAILDNGKVKCWGANESGQLGLGDTQNRGDKPGQMGDNLPYLDLGAGRTVRSLAAGYYHSCALLDDDTVKCWGANESGQLGLGDTQNRGFGSNQMGNQLPTVKLTGP